MTGEPSPSSRPATDPGRRWPGSVYRVGTEPDPRFTLANERTFLAWLRTALGLMVAAAAVRAFGADGSRWVAALLALCHFVLPFMLLLSRDVKHNRRTLLRVAVLLLVMRFVDLYWQVKPASPGGSVLEVPLRWLWLDIAALAAVGGAWLAFFLWQLKKAPLLPVGDPFLADLRANNHG